MTERRRPITRDDPDDDTRSEDSYEKVEDSTAKEGTSRDEEHKCAEDQSLREEVSALKSQLSYILQVIGKIAANEEMAELRKQLEAMRVKPAAETTAEIVRGLEEEVSSLKSQLAVRECNEGHLQAELESLKSQLALKEEKERLSEKEMELLKSRLALKEAKETELKAEIERRGRKMETIEAVINNAKSSVKRPMPSDAVFPPVTPFLPDPLYPAKQLLSDFEKHDPKYTFLPPPDVPTTSKPWHNAQNEVQALERAHMIGAMMSAIFPGIDATHMHSHNVIDLVQYTKRVEKDMFEHADNRAEYFALIWEKISKIKAELQAKKAKRLREAASDAAGTSAGSSQ